MNRSSHERPAQPSDQPPPVADPAVVLPHAVGADRADAEAEAVPRIMLAMVIADHLPL